MSVIRENGETNIKSYKKKVSTVFAKDSLVTIDTDGFLIPTVAGDAIGAIRGIIKREVLATDEDYANASMVGVDVLRPNEDIVRITVGTGTPAQTMVGETHDLDDALSVDLVAVVTNVVKVEKVISSTEVLVSFMS